MNSNVVEGVDKIFYCYCDACDFERNYFCFSKESYFGTLVVITYAGKAIPNTILISRED